LGPGDGLQERREGVSSISVYTGIDWSAKKHDIVILNESGAIITRLTIPHQAAGFQQLEGTRQALAVTASDCLVGMETAHNILIDYLWGHGYNPKGANTSSEGIFSRGTAWLTSESILASLLNQPELDSWKAGQSHDEMFTDERIIDREFNGMCLGRNIKTGLIHVSAPSPSLPPSPP
jgi:hypothetical protein